MGETKSKWKGGNLFLLLRAGALHMRVPGPTLLLELLRCGSSPVGVPSEESAGEGKEGPEAVYDRPKASIQDHMVEGEEATHRNLLWGCLVGEEGIVLCPILEEIQQELWRKFPVFGQAEL